NSPGVARGAAVRVAGRVGCADAEGVAGLAERGREGVRAAAARPGTAVDPAFERRAGLGGGEGEARGVVAGRVVRLRGDRRLRRGHVDGPGVAGGAAVRVAGWVGG